MEAPVSGDCKVGKLTMKCTKGQSGTEFLIMFGVGLAFVMGAFVIGSAYSSENLKFSQAQDAVDRLAQGVDYVYTLGPNSKEYVDVYFPNELDSVNVRDKTIRFSVASGGGKVDFFANTKADLISALPSTWGPQKILVQYLPSGKVLLGEAGLRCEPVSINLNGNATNVPLNVTNVLGKNITNVTATVTGSVSSITTLNGEPQDATLEPGDVDEFSATIAVSTPGVYGGEVLVTSDNGACFTSLTVHVSGPPTCGALCRPRGYVGGVGYVAPSCGANEQKETISGVDCCCGPTSDDRGPVVVYLNITTNPATSETHINATCSDATRGDSFISSARASIDNYPPTIQMSAGDSTFDSVLENVTYTHSTPLPGGTHIICVDCTDGPGNLGPATCNPIDVEMNDTVGPYVTVLDHTNVENLAFTSVNITGSATDYIWGSEVTACYVKLDPNDCYPNDPNPAYCPNWPPADDIPSGSYGSSQTQEFEQPLGNLPSGKKSVVCAYCKDAIGNCGLKKQINITTPKPDVLFMIQDDINGRIDVNTADLEVNTTETAYTTPVKTIKIDDYTSNVEIRVEAKSNSTACRTYYEVRVAGNTVHSTNMTNTAYPSPTIISLDLSGYSAPYDVDLYLRTSGTNCMAYNRMFNISQTRHDAAEDAAIIFTGLTDENTKLGLEVYCPNDGNIIFPLTFMNDSNGDKNALITAISSLSASTCPGAGNPSIFKAMDEAVNEMKPPPTGHGRNDSVKAIILLADSNTDSSQWYAAAQLAIAENIRVYIISYDGDASGQLHSFAAVASGEYYDAATARELKLIYQNIGN